MALQLWETLKEAIVAYTGLSPATFFTVLALGLALYYVISGFFASSDHRSESRDFAEVQPLPPPVQLGEISEEELKQYDGSDSNKPLLMAIKSQIYDISQSRMFYGPGGPYALFAGKDASRALAKMSFEEKDLTGDISGLGPFELEALQDWEYKFMSKYVKVGTIQKPVAESEEAAAGEAAESTNAEVSKPTEDTPSESPAYKTEETPEKFGMSMTRIFICYGGEWDANGNMYIGGNTKGIAISKSITYEDFLVRVYTAVRIDHEVFDIKIKCIYKLLIDSPPCDINDDEDLNFFLMGEDASVLPLFISTVPKDVISERNIQFNPYIASGSGSNHVASV